MGANVINDDIIETTTKRIALEREGVDGGLIGAYNQKIDDLQEECMQSIWLSQQMFSEYDENAMTNASVPPQVPVIDSNSEQSEVEEHHVRIWRQRTAD